MRIFPYGLVALVILVISVPTLVLAETENEANDGGSPQSTSDQTEHEGSDNRSTNLTYSNMILYVTIAAVSSVVGYSAWKVYKIRRKTASKKVV